MSAPATPVDLLRAIAPHLAREFAAIVAVGSCNPPELFGFSIYPPQDNRAPSYGQVEVTRSAIRYAPNDGGAPIVLTWPAVAALLHQRIDTVDAQAIAAAYRTHRELHGAYCAASDVSQRLWLGWGPAVVPKGMTAAEAQQACNAAHAAMSRHDRDVMNPAVVDALNRPADLLDLLSETA